MIYVLSREETYTSHSKSPCYNEIPGYLDWKTSTHYSLKIIGGIFVFFSGMGQRPMHAGPVHAVLGGRGDPQGVLDIGFLLPTGIPHRRPAELRPEACHCY